MANFVYNLFFKRTSTFLFCSVMAAFVIEGFGSIATDQLFRSINKGKLWDDIKDNYRKEAE